MERLCVSSECAVAHCSLRLLKPSCPLDAAWTREPLASQASRTLASLYARTVTSPSQPMRAPTFAYCLPLVEGVLKGSGQAVDGDDLIMRQALEIITVHACMRAAAESTDFMDEVRASIVVATPTKRLSHRRNRSFSLCSHRLPFCRRLLYVLSHVLARSRALASRRHADDML